MGKRGCTGEHLTGRFGPSGNAWRGGTGVTRYGYIEVYVGHDHPMANSRGRVNRPRLVMSKRLGRPLESNELVHHLNGIKTDDRPENLSLTTRRTHPTLHHTWKREEAICSGCGQRFIPPRKPRRNRVCCSRQCSVTVAQNAYPQSPLRPRHHFCFTVRRPVIAEHFLCNHRSGVVVNL